MTDINAAAEAPARSIPKRPAPAEHLMLIKEAEKKDKWDCDSITKKYYRLRAQELPDFKAKLEENHWKKLKMDARRIKNCRARLAESKNKRLLLGEVQESFMQWRQEREGKDEARLKFSVDERSRHCKELNISDANDILHENDDNPEHEINAGFLFFQKHETRWKKATYHGNGFDKHEKFPDQKLTVHQALYDTQPNPISETKAEDGSRLLKYIHLPANHMGWVEQAIARHYGEDVEKSDRKLTKQTLAREFWRGQVHGGGLEKHHVHTRHLRTRCLSIPLDAGSNATAGTSFQYQEPDRRRKNFAIYLPYLHWEMYGRKVRMAETIQKAIEASGQAPDAARKVKHLKSDIVMKLKARIREQHGKTFRKDENTNAGKKSLWDHVQVEPRFENKSKLGIFLLKVARLWEAMDTEAEERLLMRGLVPQRVDEETTREPALHIRRTLDQSYFLNLEDTSERDSDQVVYRATRLPWHIPGNLTRVVMVDQLWLWILDDYTIITAFPRRWGRNKPDSSGIHKSLRNRLDKMDGEVTSVWHLATIIIDQCSRVFFDRTKPLDLRPEVMDLFAESLNNVNERTTIAFQSFWAHAGSLKRGEGRPSPRYLSINPEGVLLREAQDIAEELRMMTRIYVQQLGAVEEFRNSLLRWNRQRGIQHHRSSSDAANSSQRDSSMDIEIIEETMEHIRARKAEIEELASAAERSCQNLQGLLALKQQQASIVEAQAALERADHGVRQQKLSIKLSEQSYEQGKSIMAFTIMTIIFTPLGFFTSFFGMNNSSTGQEWMPLWQQIVTMLCISAFIILIFLVAAFKKSVRHPVKTARTLLAARHCTEEGRPCVTESVSSLNQRPNPAANASFGGSPRTFRTAHPSEPLNPVEDRLASNGSWRRASRLYDSKV
ncbi:hypothetical protein KVR01_010284 [Diaporthe batatas]|uniref:uncharacterized protein n=1 Tax=Diaporthe batatas TaxID=748121 RepID=UPI001D0436E8|nr:uncharacterized protein KVR01_010284 [Diaporthe batatas]KAG8159647.1 hypothetical protein KVR01_010284 [Diaporthe batatas]